ncbi:hypothetical protein AAG570_012541 [Ranatra chinensis]|uniref:Uncharacterized protein n=1 Tax=Ranatra chinensis TaxID=642074 RepID=A0ABD0YE59_9HEMI
MRSHKRHSASSLHPSLHLPDHHFAQRGLHGSVVPLATTIVSRILDCLQIYRKRSSGCSLCGVGHTLHELFPHISRSFIGEIEEKLDFNQMSASGCRKCLLQNIAKITFWLHANFFSVVKSRVRRSLTLLRLETIFGWITLLLSPKSNAQLGLDQLEDIYHEARENLKPILNAPESVESFHEEEMFPLSDRLYSEYYAIFKYLRRAVLAVDSKPSISSTSGILNPTSFDLSIASIPKLEVTPFDGDFRSFDAFYASFTSIIHENAIFSNTQKLPYLINALDKQTKNIIAHLPLRDASYQRALHLLKTRFSNPLRAATAHTDSILKLPNPDNPTAKPLRQFIDTHNIHYNAISNLTPNNVSETLSGPLYPWLQYANRRFNVPTLSEGLQEEEVCFLDTLEDPIKYSISIWPNIYPHTLLANSEHSPPWTKCRTSNGAICRNSKENNQRNAGVRYHMPAKECEDQMPLIGRKGENEIYARERARKPSALRFWFGGQYTAANEMEKGKKSMETAVDFRELEETAGSA